MKRKNRQGNWKKKIVGIVTSVSFSIGVLVNSITVSAAATTTGVAEVDAGLKTVKTLMLGTVSAIGLIILIKNVGDFAQAFQQQDSQGMHMAGKGIAAGLIMTVIGPVITALGF